MTKDKIRKYFIDHYNLEIEELAPLLEFASRGKKELSIYKKSIKKRKAFLDKTIRKWQEQTKKIFLSTDVRGTYFRNGAYRFSRLHGDPEEVFSKVFNEIQIQGLRLEYDALEQRLGYISMASSMNWFVLNLARLFPHTQTTVVNKALHLGDVNWTAVFYVFKYWQSTARKFVEDISHHLNRPVDGASDVFRKRYVEAKRKAEKEFGEVDLVLDPKIRDLLDKREQLNKAHEEASTAYFKK